MHQLAEKLKSSNATTWHIKQATSNAQVAQINILYHQHTELAQKKKKGHKPLYNKCLNPSQAYSNQDHCLKYGDTRHAQSFSCPAKKGM